MKIFLIRHGEQQYPYDEQGRKLVSSPSAPLAGLGRIQLKELGKKMTEEGLIFDALYISPVLRTQQSAGILADVLSIPNKFTMDGLKEVFPNSAEGKTYDELEAMGGDIYAHPLGEDQESLDHLVERSREAMEFIVKDARERGYRSVGIVGHGDPLCALQWTMRHEGFPASYNDMKNGFYPQKGQAYEYSFSDEEPFRLTGEGRTITTEAAVSTMEGFRNSNKEVQ